MRNVCFSSALIFLSETRAYILCLNARREDLTQVHKYCLDLGHTNNTQFKHSHFCSFKMLFFLVFKAHDGFRTETPIGGVEAQRAVNLHMGQGLWGTQPTNQKCGG